MQQHHSHTFLGVSKKDIITLFQPRANPEGLIKLLLIFVGLLLTPVSLLGSVLLYKRGYYRFMFEKGEAPRLFNLPPIMNFSLIVGGIIIWVIIFAVLKVVIAGLFLFAGQQLAENPVFLWTYLGVNCVFTFVILLYFSNWKAKKSYILEESRRHGSARIARLDELLPYQSPKGIYVGDGLFYNKQGHACTIGGTRGGKGLLQIIPNLLMSNFFPGSIFCNDPKGENASIAERILGHSKKVVKLNAWDTLGLGNTSFNCLDILKYDPINLSDDVQLISECIIPTTQDAKDSHFEDKARAYLSGLILHLVTSRPKEERHLGEIWRWLRLSETEWGLLLADMMLNDDINAGEIVRATANEMANLMKNSDREYGSIISTAQKHTDFMKSPALRESMKSSPDFHPAEIAEGNIALFLIIPADRLKSHSAYMRLVITTLIRSSVRNQGKDVLFLLDEAFSLGYNAEIELALGLYAGFGIHIWTFWQSLQQLQLLYPKSWENFIACCSVRTFFNISDNFSAEYLSKMFGQTSVPEYDDRGNIKGASSRALITPDELRRQSSETMYAVIDQLPVAMLNKVPYFKMGLDYDPNPYYKPEINN